MLRFLDFLNCMVFFPPLHRQLLIANNLRNTNPTKYLIRIYIKDGKQRI